jgi:hypothetical protein
MDKNFQLPPNWADELREILFTAGLDGVIDKLREWFELLGAKNV